ncbi:MAG: type I methionyl aminopeptidase [Clostridiales bacterium GWE2_32_10]|nr:MAG: type I methionyl aminopeptidase [Clostridiales bacterium GWE2_32_10]HBY21419.1 type I methionyl aminopeptidase [Clostridiales bacterium]
MSIRIYNEGQINYIRKAGEILYKTFEMLKNNILEGVRTKELDRITEEFVRENNGITPCKGYRGYPANICASINEELIHGIPGNKKLNNGDIISIDIVVSYKGYLADAARSFIVGSTNEKNKKLLEVVEKSFFEGIKYAREGLYVGDISKNIQQYVEQNGFSIIKEFAGHGVGRRMHEEPEIPNFFTGNKGARLKAGMVLAIEPMIAIGRPNVRVMSDGWTIVMADRKYAAHYENTIVIKSNGEPEVVTLMQR